MVALESYIDSLNTSFVKIGEELKCLPGILQMFNYLVKFLKSLNALRFKIRAPVILMRKVQSPSFCKQPSGLETVIGSTVLTGVDMAEDEFLSRTPLTPSGA